MLLASLENKKYFKTRRFALHRFSLWCFFCAYLRSILPTR